MDISFALGLGTSIVLLFSAAHTLSIAVKAINNALPELKWQEEETKVLIEVLAELEKTFEDRGSLPLPIIAARKRCNACFHALEPLLRRFFGDREDEKPPRVHLIRNSIKAFFNENQRRAAYYAFRDSVILLRDLTSDAKIQKQLSEMSSGIIELLDTGTDGDSIIERPYKSGGNISAAELPHVTTWDSPTPANQREMSSEARGRTRAKPSVHRLPLMHANSNFTVDVTLVIERSQTQKYVPTHARMGSNPTADDSWTLRYIPVRAKMDTACDYNLISPDILSRAGINASEIPILDEPVQLNGLGGTTHTLDKKVTFTWYLKRHMKSRVGDFYIVQDDSFDIVLGSRYWSGSGTNSALILQSPWKRKAQRQKEQVDHDVNMAKAKKAYEERSKRELEEILKKQQTTTQGPSGINSDPLNVHVTSSPIASVAVP